ncbi:MAG: tetratricopeptide repeat protein [Bacteroidia bacterium]|nr:tetratricopeptide repeat protein [Bacteroidia bacterium]
MFSLKQLQISLKTTLAKDMKEGFDAIKKAIRTNSRSFNDLIHQQGRFNDISQNIHRGTVDGDEAKRTQNKIRDALIRLIDDLEETDLIESQSAGNDGRRSYRLNTIPGISVRDVIGRTNDLAQLRHRLSESSSLLLMNGIGGIGKTTLAKLYANNHSDEYDHLLWIEMQETPEQSFANDPGLQSSLGIRPEQGEDYSSVCYRMLLALQNMDGKNLMILDNADEGIRTIQDRLPAKKHWDILITSRQVLSQFELMELGKLDPEAARELFRRYCTKPQDNQALGAFLVKLEHHTLSIELFAKLLEAHWEINTVEALSAYLDTQHLDDEVLQVIIESEHAKGQTQLYRHLLQAFDLSGFGQRPELMRLLKQMAALPPGAEGYPLLDLMEWCGIEQEKTTFVNHLRDLHRLGWLTQPGNNHFGCHRLIKTLIAHAYPATEEEVMPLIETFISKLSIDQTKDNPIDKFPWIPFGQAVLLSAAHLDIAPKAILQNNLASVLQALGDYAGAKVLLEKAMASDERNFGELHPTTAIKYSNLALVLKDLGEYAKARNLLQKAMTSAERNFGELHPTTAVRYSNLALVLKDLGEYAGAKNLLKKAMASAEHHFGALHPSTAVSYSNLATVLKDLGDYAGAKKLLEKAMASDERNFGELHPSTAVSYSNLALVLKDLGEYKGAKDLLDKALASDEINFGPEHPTTALTYWNLATVYINLKAYDQARPLLEKVQQIFLSKLGENHPHSKNVNSWLTELDRLETERE